MIARKVHAMKNIRPWWAALALGLSLTSARADETVLFDFSGQYVSGSAVLVLRADGQGGYEAVSGSGTEVIGGESQAITLIPRTDGGPDVSPAGAFEYDDRILGSPLGLTVWGLLFATPTEEINIAAVGDGTYAYYQQDLYSETTFIAFAEESQAQTVPEPGTAALLALGLAVVGVRRQAGRATQATRRGSTQSGRTKWQV